MLNQYNLTDQYYTYYLMEEAKLDLEDFFAGVTHYNGYTAPRLRVPLCLLAITGIRVNELLPSKVHQLKTLLAEGWIKIDRSKRGPASHKAYLSKQGKQILKSRQKDFDLLYLFKEDNSYIFTSQLDHNKHIRREQIT